MYYFLFDQNDDDVDDDDDDDDDEMEKGGLTVQLWENENMCRNFCFSKYRVFMKTHVLLGNFNFVSCKINEIFLPQIFLLLLCPPYSLFKRSR